MSIHHATNYKYIKWIYILDATHCTRNNYLLFSQLPVVADCVQLYAVFSATHLMPPFTTCYWYAIAFILLGVRFHVVS